MKDQLFFLDQSMISMVTDVYTICEYRSVMLKFKDVTRFDNDNTIKVKLIIGDSQEIMNIRGNSFEITNKVNEAVDIYIIDKMKKHLFKNFPNKLVFNEPKDGFDIELQGIKRDLKIRIEADEVIIKNPQISIKYQLYYKNSLGDLISVLNLLLNGEQ